ncbi:MAG: hypothetical protein ACREDU_03695 [Methylocella sp.]
MAIAPVVDMQAVLRIARFVTRARCARVILGRFDLTLNVRPLRGTQSFGRRGRDSGPRIHKETREQDPQQKTHQRNHASLLIGKLD